MRKGPKVFCVGLPRTGTTSLAAGLNELGVPCLHANTWSPPQVLRVLSGDYSFERQGFQKHRAFADSPIPAFIGEIAAEHSDALFIHTRRDKDAWLRSCALHWQRRTLDQISMYDAMRRLSMFGQLHFSEALFEGYYYANFVTCASALRDRRVLKLETEKLDNGTWDLLADFLDVPRIAGKNFPHLNRGPLVN